MNKPVPTLSIVIVTYNTRQLALDCVRSIFETAHDLLLEVFIVDNASRDGTADALREAFPTVNIIANSDNRYFSAANNQGIRAAAGRYVLALNPDTLVRGDSLRQLVQYMQAHPAAGAATTTMCFPDGTLQRNGSRNVTLRYLTYEYTFVGKLFATRKRALNTALWYSDWDRMSEREVGVLPGSCIIAERDTWLRAGGFDEAMPMYFSDDYFSLQVRKTGKQTVYVPTDGILHYENASTKQVSRRAMWFYFRDLLGYTRRVFGRPAQMLLALLLIPTVVVQYLRAKR